MARRKGSYGIDAPYLLLVPAVLILANLVNGFISKTLWPFLAAFLIMSCCGLGLYASRRGKLVEWAELLRNLKLHGDERILDLVCGRGAVLLLAAQHLTTGRAVGVDLWRKPGTQQHIPSPWSSCANGYQVHPGFYRRKFLLVAEHHRGGRGLSRIRAGQVDRERHTEIVNLRRLRMKLQDQFRTALSLGF